VYCPRFENRELNLSRIVHSSEGKVDEHGNLVHDVFEGVEESLIVVLFWHEHTMPY